MINKVHFFLIGCIVIILFYSFNKKEHIGIVRTNYQNAYLPGHKPVGLGYITPKDCKSRCEQSNFCVGVDIQQKNATFSETNSPSWCGQIMGNDLPSGTTLKLVTNDAYNSSTFTTWINPNYRDPKTIDYSDPIPKTQIKSGVYLKDHKQVGTAKLTPLECYFACERDTECAGVDIYTPKFDWQDPNIHWCGMIKKADLKTTPTQPSKHATLIDDDNDAKQFSSYIKTNVPNVKSSELKIAEKIHRQDQGMQGVVFNIGSNNTWMNLHEGHIHKKWNNRQKCEDACIADTNCKGYTWYPAQANIWGGYKDATCKTVSDTTSQRDCVTRLCNSDNAKNYDNKFGYNYYMSPGAFFSKIIRP